MYVKIGFASNIMNEIFERDNQNYNFRRDFLIEQHKVSSICYEMKQILLLAQTF